MRTETLYRLVGSAEERPDPVPTYVVEFLLGRYCASTDGHEIEEGLTIVERRLGDRMVRTGEEELLKARAREQGWIKLIDIGLAKLDSKTDSFIAERLSSIRGAQTPRSRPHQATTTLTLTAKPSGYRNLVGPTHEPMAPVQP